jgi:hypothetical protein
MPASNLCERTFPRLITQRTAPGFLGPLDFFAERARS